VGAFLGSPGDNNEFFGFPNDIGFMTARRSGHPSGPTEPRSGGEARRHRVTAAGRHRVAESQNLSIGQNRSQNSSATTRSRRARHRADHVSTNSAPHPPYTSTPARGRFGWIQVGPVPGGTAQIPDIRLTGYLAGGTDAEESHRSIAPVECACRLPLMRLGCANTGTLDLDANSKKT
jgi:hypothetical protein